MHLAPVPGRPHHLLTRIEVARILRRSKASVMKYERQGKLHAVIDRDGIHRFARSEVEQLAKTLGVRAAELTVTGELAADAFKLFLEGASLGECVMRTKLRPDQVRELYAEYVTPLGAAVPRDPDLSDFDERAKSLEDELAARRRARGKKGPR